MSLFADLGFDVGVRLLNDIVLQIGSGRNCNTLPTNIKAIARSLTRSLALVHSSSLALARSVTELRPRIGQQLRLTLAKHIVLQRSFGLASIVLVLCRVQVIGSIQKRRRLACRENVPGSMYVLRSWGKQGSDVTVWALC